jgi:ABC-type phosphate transport system substrate-binding protein
MMSRTVSCALAGAALLVAAGRANAAPIACIDSTNTSKVISNPIYVAGSTALGPTLQALAPAAKAAGYTLVHYDNGSCGAVANITSGNNMIPNPTGAKSPQYFLDDGSGKKPCLPSDANGAQIPAPIDVVLSDVDPRLCPNVAGGLPSGFSDQTGPVNGMVIAVPMNSQQTAISAEQAYLVFGLGADGAVSPWTGDPATTYHVRGNTSGTRAMVNANIGQIDQGGIGPMKGNMKAWFGHDEGGAGPVIAALTKDNPTPSVANQSIGIIGINDLLLSMAGATPAPIKALAFRAFGQKTAYWPGSTQNALDMRNVRDGRYKIWGYVHMITPTSGKTQAATDFLSLINDPNSIDGTIKAGLTPICAMHVTHDYEGQDQKAFTADKPCDCYFEFKATGTAPSSCKSCMSNSDCGTGRCDLHGSGSTAVGYCQAQ